MRSLSEEIFVCLDCETTGLDSKEDRIIEVACVVFKDKKIIDSFESLINPERVIPEETIKIHNITNDMVKNQPTIDKVLDKLITMIGSYPIVGHGIQFDVDLVIESGKRALFNNTLFKNTQIDTLRLARLYGQSPTNALDMLRRHFNIEAQGAHRAMSDVQVNVEVFYHLVRKFKNLNEILDSLMNPIEMKNFPLGKHKGRPLKEMPINYLVWASKQEFDRDLIFSIQKELKRRSSSNNFTQSPFKDLKA
jgi:DNA polymerase-3 subunit epsilon